MKCDQRGPIHGDCNRAVESKSDELDVEFKRPTTIATGDDACRFESHVSENQRTTTDHLTCLENRRDAAKVME